MSTKTLPLKDVMVYYCDINGRWEHKYIDIAEYGKKIFMKIDSISEAHGLSKGYIKSFFDKRNRKIRGDYLSIGEYSELIKTLLNDTVKNENLFKCHLGIYDRFCGVFLQNLKGNELKQNKKKAFEGIKDVYSTYGIENGEFKLEKFLKQYFLSNYKHVLTDVVELEEEFEVSKKCLVKVDLRCKFSYGSEALIELKSKKAKRLDVYQTYDYKVLRKEETGLNIPVFLVTSSFSDEIIKLAKDLKVNLIAYEIEVLNYDKIAVKFIEVLTGL